MSYILRGTSKNHGIRIFAADTTSMVEEARRLHNTSPVASAALGRALTASSIMGIMMKGDNDKLTLSINGKGPLGTIVCVADSKGTVKGYVSNPLVDIPSRADGKLDVGSAVGINGLVTIIKDMGMKEPYTGQYPLVNGEIAEDLTAYYAYSEQQPSAIALGVLVDVDYSIKAAGGFIVQLMPEAEEKDIDILEKNLSQITSVSHLIDDGKTPEDLINLVLKDLEPMIYEKIPVSYKCDCSRERIEKALISIGKKDLDEIIKEDKLAEISCHFCNTVYHFNEAELIDLRKSLDN
ncbi:molecular chaperone Hsp33 [Acetoanaerobium noterae]|jgi:molecular chaperone Hsp33|uniref:33 kDa chaperonin n=1 Tax=Acetoanaerobium noterae TaxID=745369 RepID=A0A1T5BNM6_9FIRM|nr:Hsp33 family molecular chaperone HslO [Acetoanaerobium noterae]MBP9562590.1 Hsp33 family molecular chaperone HslO [Acetoanaerobium sp.]SKB48902.1 molecular chaperone Hsp33 [Acetoanaerobium noterae]